MTILTDPKKLVTVQFDEATAATHEVVALTAGQRITVYEAHLRAVAANDVSLTSAATVKIGPVGLIAGGAIDKPANQLIPVVQCVAGEAFQVVLTTTGRVTGWFRYIKE
jgi:alpha-tubulin suppressor-like RCC1 family protein